MQRNDRPVSRNRIYAASFRKGEAVLYTAKNNPIMFVFAEKPNKTRPFSDATVEQMAQRRERRAAEQNELLMTHGGCFVISLTLNIAGPVKRGALSDTAFLLGVSEVQKILSDLGFPVVAARFMNKNTGIELLLAAEGDATAAKKAFSAAETNLPAGRLYDIDVIVSPAQKLSRSEPRRCLICGEQASVCARSRAHSVEQLQKRTEAILADAVAKHVASIAHEALIEEVHLTPKPGLVDENNCGANPDMCVEMFEKSAAAIRPYFERIAKTALNARLSKTDESIAEIMAHVRRIGIEAEKAMLEATGGVNTHRGAIYALGLGVFACAYLVAEGVFSALENGVDGTECFDNMNAETLLSVAGTAARALGDGSDPESNGAKVRKRYGVGGAVEQAFAGFPLALLAKNRKTEYYGLKGKRNDPLAGAYALISVMALVDDNNALKRGGSEGARFVKARAEELLPIILQADGRAALNALEAFDKELIERNINCGGAADLLALALFIEKAERLPRVLTDI